jgi:methyltransferase (TIGR00027 family)
LAADALRGAGKTALGVAIVRAAESARAGRLFDDPLAQAFVDAAPGTFSSGRPAGSSGGASLWASFYAHVVIRTRFFDDYLNACAAAGCRQVVQLAAGLDTRAFRLAWPDGTRGYEVDLPQVLAFKDEVLASRRAVPRCQRAAVPADLRGDWAAALAGAGFDQSRPAAWLAEGILLYLTADEARRLLADVTRLSAPGSRLAFEHSPQAAATLADHARQLPGLREYRPLWKGGLGDAAPAWLAGHGWQPDFHDLGAVADSYRRPLPAPEPGGFLTATRDVR